MSQDEHRQRTIDVPVIYRSSTVNSNLVWKTVELESIYLDNLTAWGGDLDRDEDCIFADDFGRRLGDTPGLFGEVDCLRGGLRQWTLGDPARNSPSSSAISWTRDFKYVTSSFKCLTPARCSSIATRANGEAKYISGWRRNPELQPLRRNEIRDNLSALSWEFHRLEPFHLSVSSAFYITECECFYI